MESKGKICPYCKKEFNENDEVACFACRNLILKSQNPKYTYFSKQQNNDCNLHSDINMNDDMYRFIGVNQEDFLKKFQELNNKKIKVSWSWSSAFVGAYWYAYRKMYKVQFLYYVAYLVYLMLFFNLMNSIIFSIEPSLILVLPFIFFGIPFMVSGILGNYIYKCHVEKHVKRAKGMEDDIRQNYLMKKGGTSDCAVAMIICTGILIRIICVVIRS